MPKSDIEKVVDFLNNVENITVKLTDGAEFVKLDDRVTSVKKKIVESDITSITYLDLSNNNLLGLPDCVGELINLEVVILDNNHFTKPTRVLRGMKKLRVLSMRNNNLTYLPTNLTIHT